MITSAWEWARANNCLRVNPVHKEEEARLILNDAFSLVDETGSEIIMSGSMDVEDSVAGLHASEKYALNLPAMYIRPCNYSLHK